MKTKIIFLILYLTSIIYLVFTKNSEVMFLGDNFYYYNYGFPLRCFITDQNNSVIHIYTSNVLLNILLLFPLISSTLLSLKLKKYIIFNNAISILFSLTVIFTLFLTWQYKKIIYSCAIVLYFIWLFWFVFLIYRYLYFKRETK